MVLLLTLTFALVPFVPRAAADSGTWTTDADFTAPYAVFVGTEVLGTGVPAQIDLMRDAHGWTNRDPSSAPGAREGPGMTFSTYDNVSVLFGGYNTSDLQDTWEYDYGANAWTEVTTSPHPPGREWPGLSYDPVQKLVVLFGGVNSTNGFLNDTWEFNVVTKTWTERSPTFSPPPLADNPFAYFADVERHVVFGQSLINNAMVTWGYDAASHTWTHLTPATTPSVRNGFAIAYHAARHRIVLFGGVKPTFPVPTPLSETWEYAYGVNWTQVSTSGPSGRAGHAMTYRPGLSSVYLFGGNTANGLSYESWRYDASQTWQGITTPSHPPARYNAGLAGDAAHDAVILFGGLGGGGTELGDTWSLQSGYRAGGKYASPILDSGGANVVWDELSWNRTPANQPVNTSLVFQIAVADVPTGPWSFFGPDGTPQTHYTAPGVAIWGGDDAHRYLRVLADFASSNATRTPHLEDITITFHVPPSPPYLVSTDPADATPDVPTDKTIHIVFSKPMDPSSLVVTFLLGPPVSLSPQWINNNSEVDLVHAQPFVENAAYRIQVSAKDTLGLDLAPGLVPNPFTFSTQKINPKVLNTNPRQAQANVPEGQPVFVNFSEPMDVSSVTWSTMPFVSLSATWSNGNKTLELLHATPFTPCVTYAADVNGTDLAGLGLIPGPAPNPWSFSATCHNPYLESTSPSDLGQQVPFTADVVMTFSEAMAPSTVTFSLQPTVMGSSLAWSNGNSTLTMSHTSPFNGCGVYTATVTGRDADEGLPLIPNPFQPYTITNPWKFITVCANPYVLVTRPADGATNVSVAEPIFVAFGNGMTASTVAWDVTGGSFRIVNSSWNPLGTTVTVNHDPFQECRRYTVHVTGTGGGLPLVPGLAPNPWSFDVECVSPYVTNTDPADGATGVALDAPIIVHFDKPMNASSAFVPITPAVSLTQSWSDGNKTLTLTHAVSFAPCTSYLIYVDGTGEDGRNILLGGDTPGVPNPWTFTTVCPQFAITRTDPADNATNVILGLPITVSFSHAANPATLEVTIVPNLALTPTWSDGNATVTLDHAWFADCAWHTVTVYARDTYGNPLVNITGSKPNPWTFRTACIPSQILSTDPANGTTDVAQDASIIVTFSRAMNTATVNWSFAPVLPFSFTASWTNGDRVLTLTHVPPFPLATTYNVTITGEDSNGDALAPGPAPNPWTFTTLVPATEVRGLQVSRTPPPNPTIVLTWKPVLGAASYTVYSSLNRAARWPWPVLGVVPVARYVHTSGYGDGLPHYYIVRARSFNGVEGGNSSMGVKYALNFTFTTNFGAVSHFSLPYRSTYHSAKDISDELTEGRIDWVAKWNPATQTPLLWVYFRGAWRGTNFAIGPGDGLYLGYHTPFSWILNGTDGAVAHAFTPYPPPNTNVHWFGLPFTANYSKASDLVRDVEGSPTGHSFIDEVGRWDTANQVLLRYRWAPGGWIGPDFAVAPGDGLYFVVRLNFIWTPKLIIPEVP